MTGLLQSEQLSFKRPFIWIEYNQNFRLSIVQCPAYTGQVIMQGRFLLETEQES